MLAFLFPGGGGQQVGMGLSLSRRFPAAAAVFAEADAALGWSLSRLCFEGPVRELRMTACAQPAILTLAIAVLRALESALGPLGPAVLRPDFVAGHSSGEYAALVCAGALDFADAVRLVHLRGRAMQKATPAGVGLMAAVLGLPADEVAALCAAQGAEVACLNTSRQTVISGAAAAVRRAAEEAVRRGATVHELDVSIASHCALMAPAQRTMQEALHRTQFAAARVPVLANVDAAPHHQGFAELLTRQLTARVLWTDSMAQLLRAGVSEVIELGGGELGKMAHGLRATSVQTAAEVEALQRRASQDLAPYTQLWRTDGFVRRPDGVCEDAAGSRRLLADGSVWRFADAESHGMGF